MNFDIEFKLSCGELILDLKRISSLDCDFPVKDAGY